MRKGRILIERAIHSWNVYKTKIIYKRIDINKIPNKTREIRLFAIARNESLRLPYFINYYFKNGVDRIFLIDNNSTDNTVDIALSYPNIHIFRIAQSFKRFWFWMEFFIEKYGKDCWCVVVDIDELLFFPYAEIVNLKALVNYLEYSHYDAFRCFLLDTYSDKSIINTNYFSGRNPIDSCPYFDPQFLSGKVKLFDKKRWEYFESIVYSGGMRERVFNKISDSQWNYYLSKIPLFKYSHKVYLTEGMHAINNAQISDISGVVFHTKFLYDFIEKANLEAKREVHYDNALEYKIYSKAFSIDKNLSLKYSGSVKFKNSRQLLKLGIMTSSFPFNNFLIKDGFDVVKFMASTM